MFDSVHIVDICSSKIICTTLEKKNREYNLLAISQIESRGVVNGVISNFNEAYTDIRDVIKENETKTGIKISEVIISIPPFDIKSHFISIKSNINGKQINSNDIEKIFEMGYKKLNSKDIALHCFPIEYILDGNTFSKNPEYLFANTIESLMHFILVNKNIIYVMERCFSKLKIKVSEYIISSYPAAIACLTEDEQKLGTTLIDIGKDITSISIFKENSLVYIKSFFIAGEKITKDIAWAFSISLEEAERIKKEYGFAINISQDSGKTFFISQGKEIKSISPSELCNVIRARLEEIILKIKEYTNQSSISVGNIVITGGSSQIKGLKELASNVLEKDVRIYKPVQLKEYPSFNFSYGMASTYGLIKIVKNRPIREDYIKKIKNKNFILKFFEWVYNNT